MIAPRHQRVDFLEPKRLRAVVELWRETGHRTEIPVQGGSMLPVLRPGWILQLDHSHDEHPFGSIIVFLQGRLLVAHRIVGRARGGAYLTKGDALVHFDRVRVVPDKVVGRVVSAGHDGGTVIFPQPPRARDRRIALFSRVVGELHRMTRPLQRLGSAAGRFFRLPGPTRLLKSLTRAVMRRVG